MRSFYHALLRHRVLTLGLLFASTAWLASALLPPDRLLVDFSLDALLVPDETSRDELLALHDDFGDDLDLTAVLVTVPPPHTVADRGVLDRIAALGTWLRARPEVDAAGVLTLLDLPDLGGPLGVDSANGGARDEGSAIIRPAILASTPDAALPEAATRLSAHRSFRGAVLSADLRTTLVLAPFSTTAPERRHALLDDLAAELASLAAQLPPGSELHPVGIPLVQATYTRIVIEDILLLVPLTILVIAALLGLAFRRVYAIVGPLTGVGLATLSTLGLIQHLGLPFDMVNSVAGVVILVVGVAAGAHIVARHREELGRLRERAPGPLEPAAAAALRREAIVAAMERMTPACFVTSATTAVGFGSLAAATLPAIQNFGLVLAAGVMMAWAIQMIWMPIALSFVAPDAISPLPSRGPHGGETLFSRFLERTAGFVLANPARIVFVGLALAIAAGAASLRLHADARAAGELASDHPVSRGLSTMQERLSGVLIHAIVLRGTPLGPCESDSDCADGARCRRVDPRVAATQRLSGALTALTDRGEEGADPVISALGERLRPKPAGLFDEVEDAVPGTCAMAVTDPRALAFIADLTAFLEQAAARDRAAGRTPLVSRVQSLLDLVLDLGPLPRADGTGQAPRRRADAVAERLGLLESGAPELSARLVTPERTRTQIVIRANDIGLAAWRDFAPTLSREIERARVAHGLRDDFAISLTGGSTLAERAISGLAEDLARSLAWSVLLILAFIAGLVRSLRLGLLAMVPNLLPLLLTLGIMGALDIPIRASTLIVFSVAFGIAVDDTTHLIHRYREEVERRGEGAASVRVTLIATGHPIVLTSAILVCGFLMNAMSDFLAIVEFGLLSAVTLLLALVVELYLTPALLLMAQGRLGRWGRS